MTEDQNQQANIDGYDKFLNESSDNQNNQKCQNIQNHTSESISEVGSSNHNQEPQKLGAGSIQRIEVKNGLTERLENKSYLSEKYQILKQFCNENIQKQEKEMELIGNKRLSPDTVYEKKEDISQTFDKPNMEETQVLNDIITQIHVNCVEFIKKISSYFYDIELDLTKETNMLFQNLLDKDNLGKKMKQVILMGQEKEKITKLEMILQKEKESNNLKFFKMLETDVKNYLLMYINDRIINLDKFRLNTLKDNSKFSEEQKKEIQKMIIKYINLAKESTSNNSGSELTNLSPPSDLNPLSNNDALDNDDINNVASIGKNKNQNSTPIIQNQEKEEEQKNSTNSTNDISDKGPGGRLENLVRMAVNKIFLFVFKIIEKLLTKINRKIKKVHIYKDITGNSAIKYRAFFGKIIEDILDRKNEQLIKDILNDNSDLEEIRILKELFKMKFLTIIEKFIKDEILTCINGVDVKINILEENEFNDVKETKNGKNNIDKISGNMKKIKEKIKDIIGSKGKLKPKEINDS